MLSIDMSSSRILEQTLNLENIFCTFDVSNVYKLIVMSTEHSLNISLILTTLDVLNMTVFINSKDEQTLNIWYMFITFKV